MRRIVHKACEGPKYVLSNRGLKINGKKHLYEGVIVTTALYGAKALGTRIAEEMRVNFL